ncbi:MAG: poly(3-hydroxybutyrate) depolymerase [Burkholderiales bacterium PBB5]|nr:MAG: poly(3-hydroxybutyrate) depolymerase [Burkholderiales bacterium PBB5]
MLYQTYQAHADLSWPLRTAAKWWAPLGDSTPLNAFTQGAVRKAAAACQVLTLSEVTHARPPWRIDSVDVAGEPVPVSEQVVLKAPFGTLLRFCKEGAPAQPKVLVVAPMSGHFATLLRDTVRTLLQDHEVCVTDWHNVRDVPLEAGRFGLDEYIQYLIDFLAEMGPGASVTPVSLTLMAGPIDCRISPTEVNKLATTQPISWFEEKLISRVPLGHAGVGRRVYPGFVQLSAFMSMNKQRHIDAFKAYYRHVVDGEFEQAEVTRTFYEEYMAVADLSADFYLETVSLVFQEYALPLGQLRFKGRVVKPSAIRRTALLTVEGERDDICAIGQTLAAQDLASSLRPYMRTHYVQPNVGHYGVFSGKRWQNHIYPIVRDVIHVSQ